MANKTAWVSGNNSTYGAGYAPAFQTTGTPDLASLAVGSTVLSSLATIDNTTASGTRDIYMDISVVITIASTAVVAGNSLSVWMYDLQADNTTLGDGLLTAGAASPITPGWAPLAVITLTAGSARTKLIGSKLGIVLPPRQFRLALQNNGPAAFTSAAQIAQIQTYNENLNN